MLHCLKNRGMILYALLSFTFRYSDPFYWSPFVVIGKDPIINFSTLRHAMLDQAIDRAEIHYKQHNQTDPLNPPPTLKEGRYFIYFFIKL